MGSQRVRHDLVSEQQLEEWKDNLVSQSCFQYIFKHHPQELIFDSKFIYLTHSNLLQNSCLENGWRNLAGYCPWGHKEFYTTEWLTRTIYHRTWLHRLTTMILKSFFFFFFLTLTSIQDFDTQSSWTQLPRNSWFALGQQEVNEYQGREISLKLCMEFKGNA